MDVCALSCNVYSAVLYNKACCFLQHVKCCLVACRHLKIMQVTNGWHWCSMQHDTDAACCMTPMLPAAWHQCCLLHDTNAAWHQCSILHDTNAACCVTPMQQGTNAACRQCCMSPVLHVTNASCHQCRMLHDANAAHCMTPMLHDTNAAYCMATMLHTPWHLNYHRHKHLYSLWHRLGS